MSLELLPASALGGLVASMMMGVFLGLPDHPVVVGVVGACGALVFVAIHAYSPIPNRTIGGPFPADGTGGGYWGFSETESDTDD